METTELIFIAAPLMGHLVYEVELARNLVSQHPRISISILIPNLPLPNHQITAFIQSLAENSNNQISIVELPPIDNLLTENSSNRFSVLLDHLSYLYRPIVKQFVDQLRRSTAGIAVDIFCTPIIDVAEELGLPSYILFPSGANLLCLMLHLESHGIDETSEFSDLTPKSTPLAVKVSGFRNPLPLKVWPVMLLSKTTSAKVVSNVRKYRSTNGILVNTFTDLESDLLLSLLESERNPLIYSIGPVLHLNRRMRDENIKDRDLISSWLDLQPPQSVVFLCFGSIGSFDQKQVEQLAAGIKRSGHRFLWSLRRQPISGEGMQLPTDYDNFNDILPEKFLEQTAGFGKVIGWAPQTEVLAHAAIGAFVSHCGWNSLLESLWFGVPVVTWPMYAEQQLNAFLLTRELKIAVELTVDYLFDFTDRKASFVVMAEDVEKGIRRVMEEDEGIQVRKKVKEMSRLARKAMELDGSSNKSLRNFAEDVIKNSLTAQKKHLSHNSLH